MEERSPPYKGDRVKCLEFWKQNSFLTQIYNFVAKMGPKIQIFAAYSLRES